LVSTFKQLVNPKDPTAKEKECRVVYRIHCMNCEKGHIRDMARTFGTKLKKHNNIGRALLTAVVEHFKGMGHSLDTLSIPIVSRDIL